MSKRNPFTAVGRQGRPSHKRYSTKAKAPAVRTIKTAEAEERRSRRLQPSEAPAVS